MDRRLPLFAAWCLIEPTVGLAVATGNAAYSANYGSAAAVDQAAYESAAFWGEVRDNVPGFNDAPELARYRGWVGNLITKTNGECATLDTGQEVLTQYVFPGLQGTEAGRTPFPSLPDVEAALRALAPTAQEELTALLAARPLVDDDAPADDDADDADEAWRRAAWYGWQFMSLRDAKAWMPKTIRALEATVPLAHRFIGIARQRAGCRGTLHSDRRNYLLSTLTGLSVPAGACAVAVPGSGEEADGEERPTQERTLADGEVVVLDNTFKHYVYNNHASADRFVLMVEIWHPGLTAAEREALATTFAVKDRFTLTGLKQVPWGFSDEELEHAIASRDYKELDFWRRAGYGLEAE